MILRGLTEQMGCPKCGEKFRPNAAEPPELRETRLRHLLRINSTSRPSN